jgi:hypothetical protein
MGLGNEKELCKQKDPYGSSKRSTYTILNGKRSVRGNDLP